MSIYIFIGFIGVAFYLGSYAALQLGYISGRGYLYPFLNLVGACLVAVNLIAEWNMSSAVISFFYATISIIGMSRNYLLDRTIRFDTDDARVIEAILPGLEKHEGRQLLRLGRWVDGPDRMILMQEGKPISDLIWVRSGTLSVLVGGHQVARMGEGAVLGEATCLSGAPATATVLVLGSARYFAIPSAKLRHLATTSSTIRGALQDSFARELRQKLHETNKRAASGISTAKAS